MDIMTGVISLKLATFVGCTPMAAIARPTVASSTLSITGDCPVWTAFSARRATKQERR